MTGKVVNLRTARKRKSKDAASRAADENAARHGRSKGVKSLEDARAEKAQRDHDGHRRDQ